MASTSKQSSKQTTAPKGRPTPKRGQRGRRSRISPTLQWALLVLVIVVAAVVAFILLDGGIFSDPTTTPGIPREGIGGG